MTQDDQRKPQTRPGNAWMIGPDGLIPLNVEVQIIERKRRKKKEIPHDDSNQS
jgi:hypothetical protein